MPRVALLIETSKSFGRGVLRGINRYVREREHWSFYLEPRDLGTSPPAWLHDWRGDGIIARISTPQLADAVLRAQLPTINLSSAIPTLSIPRIETCPKQQASLAAQHLLERGFRNFGFCGDALHYANWSDRIFHAFQESLESTGCKCGHFALPPATDNRLDWETMQQRLAEWLTDLPKPVGVLAINDYVGHQVVEACRSADILVPREIAVLGIENDELVCMMVDPPLTSILQHPELVGYRAAEMLQALMDGRRLANPFVSIPPIGIVTRQSTDIEASSDEVIASALRFIRRNAVLGITVDHVVRELRISRSSLDRRFKASLACTPHDEIVRTQLREAMALLSSTSLTLAEVATKSGYRHPEYMGAVFRRELGLTPGEYRKQTSDPSEIKINESTPNSQSGRNGNQARRP